jgi:hypothetical protein
MIPSPGVVATAHIIRRLKLQGKHLLQKGKRAIHLMIQGILGVLSLSRINHSKELGIDMLMDAKILIHLQETP